MTETTLITRRSFKEKEIPHFAAVAALLIALVLFLLSGLLPNGFNDWASAARQGLNILGWLPSSPSSAQDKPWSSSAAVKGLTFQLGPW